MTVKVEFLQEKTDVWKLLQKHPWVKRETPFLSEKEHVYIYIHAGGSLCHFRRNQHHLLQQKAEAIAPMNSDHTRKEREAPVSQAAARPVPGRWWQCGEEARRSDQDPRKRRATMYQLKLWKQH